MLLLLSLYTCYIPRSTFYIRPVYMNNDDSDLYQHPTFKNDTEDTENISQSYSQGKFKASPNNLREVLTHEFNDVSTELGNKLTGQIQNLQSDKQFDRDKFKQVFVIGKHIISDGKRKVVKINIKERIVPKDAKEEKKLDLGTRALLGCILFLLLGLVFTTTMKMYQGFLKKSVNRNMEVAKDEI